MDAKTSSFWVVLLMEILLTGASVFVTNPARTTVLEFYANNQPCRIITEPASVKNVMTQTETNQIHTVNDQELNDLTHSCTNSDRLSFFGFIFPGTKWCGPGNIAKGYNDLGVKSDVDRCCREHDHCPMTLEPGQCRRGICNISPFTRSHCDCDNAFKKCLREVNSSPARLIATLYFNVARITCFTDRRNCPQWMRNDLSYTWFCDEWKFVPVDNYVPPLIPSENSTINEIPDEGKRKPLEHSKIDKDLHVLYRTDEGIEKIMDNPKNIKN